MKLAICVCSRGLIFSRTFDAILQNIRSAGFSRNSLGTEWDYFPSHDKPIPDAQNYVIQCALECEPEFIWIVEEDVEPPKGTLLYMMMVIEESHLDGTTAWYWLAGKTKSFETYNGTLLYSGLGCLLVKADVFRKIEQPWFSTEFAYSFEDGVERKMHDPGNYGRHDVHFFRQCAKAGLRISLTDIECKHLYVKEYGKPMTNDGCHKIGER